MNHKKCIEILEELLNHSCDIEEAEFGWYTCCSQRDYKGHKSDCERVAAINYAIDKLKRSKGGLK